jgi:hypothetical protein
MAPVKRSRKPAGILASFVLAAMLVSAAPGVAQSFDEYQLKAVFLFNFAQFVEWSPPASAQPDAPFVIGVLGEDPFDGFLDETVRGETINNRPFLVRRYRRSEDVANCDILFVSHSEMTRLNEILAGLKGRNILTVSDAEDFARHGGMVQFVTENKRVKLKINVDAARAANLTISSKLLRPAVIVSSERG